ncbi:MAG: hypothetical protein CO118_06360 [Flavobacteriales bacterium CG_4_9_14_3_um_filter_32_8]|nr:MAG: hypothetical protein CO118_06360 [Flavobacteriales bacterium CG_4_9_14_3_um_filter_32_8]
MKNLLLTIALTFVLLNVAKADLGVPTIQAICKVTFDDTTTIEGIISFGRGGYDYSYRPSGFCLLHENMVYQLILYSFPFVKCTPYSWGDYRNGKSKLFYADNQDAQGYPMGNYEYNSSDSILTKTTELIEAYKLSDKMILYLSIPYHLYVGPDSESILIPVKKILSVEVVLNPSQVWLNKIEEARKKLIEEQKKDAWEDYLEPVWYHEIIGDEKQVTYLKQYFRNQ